jgi:hypothetical protein
VEVGVGVKLARNQIVEFSGTRREHKCQAVYECVNQPGRRNSARRNVGVVGRHRQLLAQYEGEVERELFVVR